MRRFLAVLILITLVLAFGKDVLAQPPVMGLYGTATLGGQSAPEGTEVAAYIQGELVARAQASRGIYVMNIVQPKGADYQGRTVRFTVGGESAEETTVWQAGANQPLSLTVPDASLVVLALASIAGKYVMIWSYDAEKEQWQKYDPATPAVSDLMVLKQGRGYWIKVTEDTTVYRGHTYELSRGWNLIGWLG